MFLMIILSIGFGMALEAAFATKGWGVGVLLKKIRGSK